MSEFSLSKNDRLCSRKAIGELFDGGESFFIFPLKVVFALSKAEGDRPLKAAVSVSKRNFKRAVKRNYLKRLMRETYRLNKAALAAVLSDNGAQLNVMFIYAAKELKEYDIVEKSMLKSLEILKTVVTAYQKTQSE